MKVNKKWIAFSSLMFILGFALAFGIAGFTWLKFVDNFSRFPFNQGLWTGAAIFEQEIYSQCPDFNVEKVTPEYYALVATLYEEHGSDSINCWLSDTVGGNPKREGLDCNTYDTYLEKARNLLKAQGAKK